MKLFISINKVDKIINHQIDYHEEVIKNFKNQWKIMNLIPSNFITDKDKKFYKDFIDNQQQIINELACIKKNIREDK